MLSKADNIVGYYSPNSTAKLNPAEQPGPHIIIIGSGPVGIRVVRELLSRKPNTHVTLFGNEPYTPYNRVQLSSVLAGDISRDDIDLELPSVKQHKQFNFTVCAIRNIDTENNTVLDALGHCHHYDQLVIATGSRPFVPNIPGVDQKGVYTFRNLKDTDSLYARVSSSKHIVVVGGGLLGIEAARALRRFNTKITLIQQGSRLMNRQLDDQAAKQLLTDIQLLGISIITESGVRIVHGNSRVDAVTTYAGEKIACDTVLFCTGISPNINLAREAKIKVNHGIVVDNQLRTSQHNIFSVGECCEHNGQTYGLVSPGFEQAAVLADILTGGQAHYQGSQRMSRLKVLGKPVISMGDVSDFSRHGRQQEIVYQHKDCYRKLVVLKGRIIGVVGMGEWQDISRVQEMYQQGHRIYPWQILLFRLQGKLWLGSTNNDVNLWPRSSIVCQCNAIKQGTLIAAITDGCHTLDSLSEHTSAGTVCGSCKPLLQKLLGYKGPPEKEKAWIPVLVASTAAISIAALLFFIPGFSVAESVQASTPLQSIWNDKFWKQVTGFSLLTLSIIGLLMSIRKRINSKRLGDFAYWRLLHIVLGVFCISTLILHTGFHLGSNLNHYLMINFLLVISLGAFAGMALSISHRFNPAFSQTLRKNLAWLHIIVTWPLPILLGTHILSVYYF